MQYNLSATWCSGYRVVIVIIMVLVKTYSSHFIVSFGKTLYGTFLCLRTTGQQYVASPKSGGGNCLPYVLATPSLAGQEDKYRDKINK